MSYTTYNFPNKKALKEAVKNGETVTVYEPGLVKLPANGGRVFLEGPHYPQPHKWYAEAQIDANGVVKSVK